MIHGMHAMSDSSQADALRAFLRDRPGLMSREMSVHRHRAPVPVFSGCR